MRLSVLVLAVTLGVVSTPVLAQERDVWGERGERLFFEQGCFGCHTVGKVGTPIGPDLSQVGEKHPPSYLVGWLRDPAMQKPKAHMPKIELNEDEIRALAAHLSALR